MTSDDVHRVARIDDAGVREAFATGDRSLAHAWAEMLRASGRCAAVAPPRRGKPGSSVTSHEGFNPPASARS
jgi:hypothetical protein